MSKNEIRREPTSGILNLLRDRETTVNKNNKLLRRKSLYSISSSVPWNLKRIQNMVLSVGPGTPASSTMISTTSSSSSTSSSASVDSNISNYSDSDSYDDNSQPRHDGDHTLTIASNQVLEFLYTHQNARNQGSDSNDETMHDATEETSASRRRQRQMSESSVESSTIDNVPLDSNNNTSSLNGPERNVDSIALLSQLQEASESTPPSHNANENSNTTLDVNIDSNPPNPSSSRNHTLTDSTSVHQSKQHNIPFVKRQQVPAMKHGGCINTATWMTCPWRLSTASTNDNMNNYNSIIQSSSHSSNNQYSNSEIEANSTTNKTSHLRAIYSHECPTQIITSGDDRLIKFWDASAAMGMTSLCNAGRSTAIPFSNSRFHQLSSNADSQTYSYNMAKNVKQWKQQYRQGQNLSGSVIPLGTLLSGHRGNVFHVTPIPNQPGKVASCAADGFLRLSDIEQQLLPSFTSTSVGHSVLRQNRHGRYPNQGRNSGSGRTTSVSQVIVSPEFDEDDRHGLGALRSSMCYSHSFLNSNIGLLCSERGLLKFDVRLPPVNQPMRHVFWEGDGGTNTMSSSGMRGYARRSGIRKTCKACAVWKGAKDTDDEDLDSYYVFAGGISGEVALFDLRMDGPSRLVQKYQPKNVPVGSHVSVSGLDLSRDGRELLVSYENDQIYTFPIFPESSRSGPTIGDLNNNFSENDNPLPELAAYGGHLNRFTFLKNAKYAGPNDEYICTGSDSGHAWIYERSTGDVAALLKADQSTCNGVIPHPTLPFFVTYGIDSTAKLWRGTIPVDNDIDDSPSGRAKTYLNRSYEKSLIARQWRNTQCTILELSDFVDKGPFLPDRIPSRTESDRNVFGYVNRTSSPYSLFSGPYIANDSSSIAGILQLNSYAYTRSLIAGEERPVQSGIDGLSRRIGLIRLRNQAAQLGLKSDPSVPWIMHPRKNYALHRDKDKNLFHPADLVPDFPSDWMQYDLEITNFPSEFGTNFNRELYNNYFTDAYTNSDDFQEIVNERVKRCNNENSKAIEIGHPKETEAKNQENIDGEMLKSEKKEFEEESNVEVVQSDPKETIFDTENAWKILAETVLLLKEGGNEALQKGNESLAANRYDKGLRYCAVAFMVFPCENLHFLQAHQLELVRNSGLEVNWTPLLKALITIRLNLSLAMLKSSINDRKGAMDQAQLALDALEPFCQKRGLRFIGEKLEQPVEEPCDTYCEAKELQAKAYFRLGNAKNSNMDYGCAMKNFEKSIQCKRDVNPDAKIEPILLRRLNEAKKDHLKKKKRHRKKFKSMFSSEIKNGENS